jgi:hypothetical protein
VQPGGVQLHFASRQIRIGLLPLNDTAFHCDYEFAARLFAFRVRLGLGLFVEDDLDDSGAIAHVEKQEVAEIAAASNPAENDSGFPCVRATKRSAIVCALQITEKIQHDVVPFRERKRTGLKTGHLQILLRTPRNWISLRSFGPDSIGSSE